jgi:hypothetical protein
MRGDESQPLGLEADDAAAKIRVGLAAADELPDASRATLAVTPDQAWQLAAVQKNVSGGGVEKQVWMSLRPFGDSTINEGLPSCQTIAGS